MVRAIAEVMQVIPLSMIMVNLRFIFFHLVYSISTLPASLEMALH